MIAMSFLTSAQKATRVLSRSLVSASDRRVRVILVGTGRMGHIRASLLYANPRFDLCGVVDVNESGAAALASTFRTEPFSNLGDAIDHLGSAEPVDGVVVSSPTFTHDEVIRRAAEHNVSVFTEKPVDETAEKIETLFDVADAAGINICCSFQRRFDHSYMAATEAVRFGHIGTPIMANIVFADHPSPPKEFLLSGGNIFMDLSAHDVDYITSALDDDVVSVNAMGTSSTAELEEAGVHDNASMVMTFRKGTVVNLFMSRSASYGYDQRCEIFGSSGLVSVGNEFAHSTVLSNSSGVHQSNLKHSFPQRFNQAFGAELDAFADTILLGQEWPVTADQCIRVQRVADAARQSCETGTIVELQEPSLEQLSNTLAAP